MGLHSFLGVREYVVFDPLRECLEPRLRLYRLEGEGELDLAAATDSGLCLALGNGDATFQSGQVSKLPSEISAQGAQPGDMNGDGRADYVFGEWKSSCILALASGLAPVQKLANTEQLTLPNLGDYDGDGRIDLLLNYNLLRGLQLMRNCGAGSSEADS